jgi:hypothetical protein
MTDQRAVSTEEGESLAKEFNIHFYETSAKQDTNVETSFLTIATDVKNRLIADGGGGVPTGPPRPVVLNDKHDSKSGGSCCK